MMDVGRLLYVCVCICEHAHMQLACQPSADLCVCMWEGG